MKNFSFKVETTDGEARTGVIKTNRGEIVTPVFMPVGTRATVKTASPDEIKGVGAQIILGNTYHLFLKPGDLLIKKIGGLHQFMAWDRPILTDSGGFQVFSLGANKKGESLVKIREDSVEFRSHIDGKKHIFTPEKVLDIQNNLGSDIAMVLDECAPGLSDYDYAKEAMERTHRWAEAATKYAKQEKFSMAIFGIVQGVTYPALRKQSAQYINSLNFDGNAIGGLAVGESKEAMRNTLEVTVPHLDPDKPRYLMGVGEPVDILDAVERGVDMFDCVLPTRIARNGTVFTFSGKLNLNNAQYATDPKPIEQGCDCEACQKYSRAYIRHLLNVGEILGIRLTTIHNLRFMMRHMDNIRKAIEDSHFAEYKKVFIKNYKS